MKKKYRNQDEEDRKLAMQLLGHKIDDTSQTPPPPPAPSSSVPAAALLASPEAPATTIARPSESLSVPRDDHQDPKPSSADKTAAGEDGALLQAYTACPKPGHSLIHALPFCAPASAMQHFTYRVKLMPGTTKRGRAVKTALALFSQMPGGGGVAKEKELALMRGHAPIRCASPRCAPPLNSQLRD